MVVALASMVYTQNLGARASQETNFYVSLRNILS